MGNKYVIVGAPDQVRYLYDTLRMEGGACDRIVVEGWPGRNFIKDMKKKTMARVSMKNHFNVRMVSTRNIPDGFWDEYDYVLISGTDEQDRTFNTMAALRNGVPKDKIGMIPLSVFGTKTSICRHGGVLCDFVMPLADVKPSLRYMEYHITDFCNLKCKGCGHCSNIVKDLIFSDIKEFEFSMKRLSEIFSNIKVLRLMGGEPLLCGHLYEFIDIAHKIFPYSAIKIVSNGILYKRISDRLISSMQEAGVVLQITQYPPTTKIASDIISFCQSNNIILEMSPPVEKFFYTTDSMPNVDYRTKWKKCSSKNCHFMHGLRFYPCTGVWVKHQFSDHLGKAGIDDAEHDKYSFDLSKPIKKDGWDILKMIESPFAVCDKCGDKQVMFDWESEVGIR